MNLARNPAPTALLSRMSAEFNREAMAVNYQVPAYADKPGEAPVKAKKAGKGKKSN